MLSRYIKKIGISLSLFFFVFSALQTTLVSALSLDREIRREVVLSKKHSGKELTALKKSLRSDEGYRLIIRSDQSESQIQEFFRTQDARIRVKKSSENTYILRFPKGIKKLKKEEQKLDAGTIPADIANYTIIAPEIMEMMDVSYLSGESSDKLLAHTLIGADLFQEELSTKPKIKVAILDTGIDASHSDLIGNVDTSLSYDFITNTSGSIDTNGHGTEIAGIIGGRVNGSGIYGINSNTDLISLGVLDASGVGTSYDIIEAITYARERGISLLNMSFGGAGNPENNPLCEAISSARQEGIISVVAAGNASSQTLPLPASCPDALTVGAIQADGTKASFSNYGNLVDIYALGVDIYTTTLGGGYTTKNGTSFSAPIIAGLLAKEKAWSGTATYDDIILNLPSLYGSGLSLVPRMPTDTGSTASGETLSGSISSGSISLPTIDYSTYKYYSGIIRKDGMLYGNSLYPATMDLSGENLGPVGVYTYAEYQAMLLGSTGSFQSLSVPASGLVGEWKFEGNADDTSGNGNHGTATNMSYQEDPPLGNVGVLSGSANITLPNNSSLEAGTQFSVAAWVRFSESQSIETYIAARYNSPYNAWFLGKRIQADGDIGFQIRAGGVNATVADSTAYNDDDWHFIVGTKSGSTIKLYIDNSLKATTTVSGLGSTSGSASPYIGSHVSNGGFWNGRIDGVRIYNRELSAAEISELYGDPVDSLISNSTSIPYSNPYLLANPTATYQRTSGPDNFTWNSNAQISRQSADPGVAEKTTSNAGDPVHLATGEFAYDNTLMSIPGVGLPYELKIQYKNQSDYNGPLGFNWDHTYNQYLSGETNGNVLYSNGQLGTFRFIKSGSTFLRNEGLRATLIQSGSLYSINYDDGSIASFDANNRLSEKKDISGNTLSLTYSGAYLSGVTDTLGRTISYNYYDHHRLQSVTDFTGRKVDFVYYTGATSSGSTYDLKEIILTHASGSSKTLRFEYSANASGALAHNLTRLIDAKGQVYVTNTYTSGDRVATQKYGTGTLTYTYTLSGSAITKNTVIDRLGHKTEYSYDASGNNTSIKYYNLLETSSVTYTYTHDANGLITTEERPRGNGYTYSYDSRGNLIEKRMKTDIDAADSSSDIVTTSTYNSRNELLTETNPLGKTITLTRDSSGNILTKSLGEIGTSTGGSFTGTTTYTYSPSGLLLTETSPEGRMITYGYSGGLMTTLVRGTGALMSTGTFTSSSYGTILTATDGEGGTKTFTYTPFDQVATSTTAEGRITTSTYDANGNKIQESRLISGGTTADTYYFYDDLDHLTGSLVETIEGVSVLTSITYDANGNISTKKVGSGATTRYTYNEFAKPTEERIELVPGDSSKDIVTTYTYDTNNNLISKIDPRGYTTTYTYDLFDRLTKAVAPDASEIHTTYYKDGKIDILRTTSTSGTTLTATKTWYDGYGKKILIQDFMTPATYADPQNTAYQYDRDGNITKIIDPKGVSTTSLYDGRGNLISTTDPLGNRLSTTYDKRDLKLVETVTPNTSTGITTMTHTYDDDGRLMSTTDTLSQSKSLTYNTLGAILTTTDEAGRVTTFTRDYRGLPLTSTESLSGVSITTTMSYDDRGNMTTLTDPESRVTTYQYDGINRNTRIIYPDTKEVVLTYDKSSNLTSRLDPNGTTVTSTYNNRDFLTAKSLSTGTGVGGVMSESYTYDALGRLKSSTDSLSGSLTWAYDALGRLTSESQTYSGTTDTISYAYDTGSRLSTLTYPDGRTETFTYDALDRPLTIGWSGASIMSYAYSGLLQSTHTLANGRVTTYAYDTLQRLASITPDTGDIVPETLSYDASSIITGDGEKTYSYDTLRRLISVTPTSTGNTEAYTYDKTGNRKTNATNSSTIHYTTNSLDQYTTLTGATNTNYTYDSNGNLKTDGTNTYTYDYQNRLIAVTQSGTTIASYQYDPLGRRVYKSTPTETIRYTYAGDNIVQEKKTIGSIILKKVYINGLGTDNLVAYEADEIPNQDKITFCNARVLPYSSDFTTYGYSTIVSDCNTVVSSSTGITTNRYYYHTNHLGSVIALSNSSGTVLQKYTYDSFGKPYIVTGSGTLTSVDSATNLYSNRRLYTGREYDQETKLYFNRARYYNPETGRFISRDPIGQNDQINLYTYVANSPLMYADPSGKIKMILQDTGINLLRMFVGAMDIVAGTNIVNSNGESTYEADMAEGRRLQEELNNPTGGSIGMTLLLPTPIGKKAAGGKLLNGAKLKKIEIHHFLTNINLKFTPKFEATVSRYGLKLDDAWNKALMPHSGRHVDKYHEMMLRSIQEIDDFSKGNKEIFLKEFDKVKDYIIKNPNLLYKKGWLGR